MPGWTWATVAGVGHRELRIKLPADLLNDRYAIITHAVFSILDVAGVAEESSVLVDDTATDPELNAAFDRHCARLDIDRRGVLLARCVR